MIKKNFYFGDQAIYFIYNQYEIACYAEGPVKCFCDLTVIRLETLEPAAVPVTPAEAKATIHELEDGVIPF